MGGTILRSTVCLDLDDPTDALGCPRRSTDQQGTEQGFGGRKRAGTKCLPGKDRAGRRRTSLLGQEEKIDVTSEGMIPPKNSSTTGTMLCRVMSAVTEPWNASNIWRTNGNSLGWAIWP